MLMRSTKDFVSKVGKITLAAGLLTGSVFAVEPNVRTFTSGQKQRVSGVIVSREGQIVKLRGDDDSIGTVDLTDSTKIQLRKGSFLFKRRSDMNSDSLVSGLRVEVDGQGNDKGELVADRVIFDPNSMKASRQIDTRVSPLESRTNGVESRTGKLEGRAGELESSQKRTQQQVGEARDAADTANRGVGSANQRISDLDKYQEKTKETVYFRLNSAVIDPTEAAKLDNIIGQTKTDKGFVVEVAGFADITGKAEHNQTLSEQRATAVVRYLEQKGDIPIHRILTPTGMGTSHEAADNTTSEGRKLNRRVEVRVLINQGVVSGPSDSTAGSSAQTGTGNSNGSSNNGSQTMPSQTDPNSQPPANPPSQPANPPSNPPNGR